MDTYDYEGDPRWESFLSRFEVSSVVSSRSAAMRRLKSMFYKQVVDPYYTEPTPAAPASPSSDQTQQSEPEPQQPQPPKKKSAPKITGPVYGMELWWLCCHVLVLAFTLLSVMYAYWLWFRVALLAAACAYALSLYASLPKPIEKSKAYLKQLTPLLRSSDNAHYLLYSILFQLVPMNRMALFPLAVYSSLQIAGLVQNRNEQAATEGWLQQVLTNAETLMRIVATYELLQFSMVAVSAPFLLPLYFLFLKMRTIHNQHSRFVWGTWKDGLIKTWCRIRQALPFGRRP
ncbi:hypothetical protein Pelo_10335 [Pelomyxa schiedti]|nr:hypothetical protein Pelo_10335 [Pelomyxa schiedti]